MAKKKKVTAKKASAKTSAKKAPKAKAVKAAKKAAPKKVAKKAASKGASVKNGAKVAQKTSAKKSAKKTDSSVKKTVTKKITALKNAILGKPKAEPSKNGAAKKEKLEASKPKAKDISVEAKVAKPTKKVKEKDLEKELLSSDKDQKVEEVVLTDAQGRRYCRVKDCDQLSTVDAYCRYHYLLFWKKIQIRKKILTEGKLERYIEELTARYPDKYLDMLRKDLRSEKEFQAAIQELEIDDSNEEGEFEEDSQSFIEEVRGISTEASGGSGRSDDDY